jgi:hypothetical protein
MVQAIESGRERRPRDKARSRVRANAPRREPLQDAAKRASLKMAAGAFAGLILPRSVGAKETQPTFDQWVRRFSQKRWRAASRRKPMRA